MIKLNFQYDHNSTRLTLEGLPDKSLGHENSNIGIISSWSLQIIGLPLLEGKKRHLQSLINVVLPYARHYLSGVKRSFGDIKSPIYIKPSSIGHQLILNSSQDGVEPLELNIDDAVLADLVRCLDDLRLDNRVLIDWGINRSQPLAFRDYVESVPITEKITAPIIGISSFIFIGLLVLSLPTPNVDTIKVPSSRVNRNIN